MSPRLVLNQDVVCSPLDDGGVLFDLSTKQYFALNATGLAVWQFLEDGGSLEALEATIGASSGPPGSGLGAFAQALVDHELATRDAPGSADAVIPGEPPPLPAARTPWVAPSLAPHGRPLAQVILSPFDPTVPVPE